MNRRFWLFGLLAAILLSSTGMSAPLKTLEGHVLTLDVKVAGEQIMTPMVELVVNAPAVVEVQGSQPNERYSLHLLLKDRQRAGKVDNAISIEAQLFGGNAKSQELLANPTLFIRPGQGGSAAIGSERGEIEISVLTHAIKSHTMSEAEYKKALAGCDAKASASLATASDAAPADRPRCCSAACNGPGGTLRCCGAISCCACGVCCYPP